MPFQMRNRLRLAGVAAATLGLFAAVAQAEAGPNSVDYAL